MYILELADNVIDRILSLPGGGGGGKSMPSAVGSILEIKNQTFSTTGAIEDRIGVGGQGAASGNAIVTTSQSRIFNNGGINDYRFSILDGIDTAEISHQVAIEPGIIDTVGNAMLNYVFANINQTAVSSILNGSLSSSMINDPSSTIISAADGGLNDSTVSSFINMYPYGNVSSSSSVSGSRLDDNYIGPPGRTFRHGLLTTMIFSIAYTAVFIIGFVGNFLVIGVVYRLPRMRNVTNFFIMNLAIADMLVILFCLPGTLMSNIFVPWVLGWCMCKVVPYIQGVSVAASVYSLIAVSVDRFLAIWWPLKCQITTRRARIILVMIWIYAIFVPLPWLFYFDLVSVFKEDDTLFCLEIWPEYLNGNIYFMMFNVVLGYIVPMFMISMCYILIWFKVWKRTIPTDSRDAHMERIQQSSKVKVIKMLVIVIIIFVISWLPLYLIFARIKFGGELAAWEENLLPILAPFAQFLGTANSCINPILYAYFNNKYRHGFKMLLKSRECCSLVRYYDSVNMANSSSASLRKSSYYTGSKSLRKQTSQDSGKYINCSLNKHQYSGSEKFTTLHKQLSLDRNNNSNSIGSANSSCHSSLRSINKNSALAASGAYAATNNNNNNNSNNNGSGNSIHRQASQETYATLLLNKQLSQERYATFLLNRQTSLQQQQQLQRMEQQDRPSSPVSYISNPMGV